jgi:hypothetical protein
MCYIRGMRVHPLTLVLLLACNQTPTPQKEVAAPSTASPSTSAQVATRAADVMDDCPGHTAGKSCGDTPAGDATQSQIGAAHFGQAFQLDKRETLATAASRIGDVEETVQVSGIVEAVCKKKGCWMELKDGDTSAKVFTYAGEFYLPVSTAKGRKAVVEGTLKVKTMTKKFAQHLAEDQGEDPSKVTGDERKLVIEAKSISLL